MLTKKLDKFIPLEDPQLEEIDGGLIITGTLVAAGIGVFAAGFGVGYSIGAANKKK